MWFCILASMKFRTRNRFASNTNDIMARYIMATVSSHDIRCRDQLSTRTNMVTSEYPYSVISCY